MKIIKVMALILLLCFLSVGCSSNDKKEIELIKSSLEAQEYFQTNEYKIEDVKLHSSEEKDNKKVDTCTIVFSNDVVRYTTDFEFKFANYSNHWELTEYDAINEKNNKSEPVSGVTEENIKKMLKNQELSVANVIFNAKFMKNVATRSLNLT